MLTYIMENRGSLSKTDFLIACIKEDILNGFLSENEKMPSKRSLAEHLGVSVITVERSYEILMDEGWLYALPRKGFFVRGNRSVDRPADRRTSGTERRHGNLRLDTDQTGARLNADQTGARHDAGQTGARHDADSGQPDYTASLRRTMRKVLTEDPQILQTSSPRYGYPPFRRAIASYLRRFRGMDVSAENIIVGSGSEYLYGQIALLFGRDKIFAIEDPSYEKIRLVYQAMGVTTVTLPLGEDGIDSAALASCRADVMHISPFHSFPGNITVPVTKRREYLLRAAETGAFLVEDDFDSEFTYLHRPLETLFTMDAEDRVIYMNSFSKSLAPSIRVGYMILPRQLMEIYEKKCGFYTSPVPVFDQAVLAEYLDSGQFERHLGRMRRLRRE